MIEASMFAPTVSYPTDSEEHFNGVNEINEAVAPRKMFYRLGDSELFQYANKNAVIGGVRLVDIIPKMVMPDSGFIQVDYASLDKTVQYELFDGPHYKLSCKKTMKENIDSGKVQMVYSENIKLPTCIPYIIQGTGSSARVFVNISDIVTMDDYGKFQITRVRNYGALMALLVAANAAYSIVRTGSMIPADLGDGMVLVHASMMERVINSVVHMDPITKDKVKYLATEFALVQMYGTADGQKMFYDRYKNKYFPKLSKMVTDAVDAQFQVDSFDKLSNFVEELKRHYQSMKGINEYTVFDKWIRLFGSVTSLSIDYMGYHLYTICMILFESPLISRMALEPVMEKNRGADMYQRIQTIIGTR